MGALWGSHRIAGEWDLLESAHINVLELRAIPLVLKHWLTQLKGEVIVVHSDNRIAIAYILKEGGTKLSSLWQEVRLLIHMCDRWEMTLQPAYFPAS